MPTKVENLSAFLGYSSTSKLSYLFNDTMSEHYTWPSDPVDFCGPKRFSFKLNSAYTTDLSGGNGGKITLSPDLMKSSVGEYKAQLYGYL